MEQTEIQIGTSHQLRIVCCDTPLEVFNNGQLFCKQCLKKYKINQN